MADIADRLRLLADPTRQKILGFLLAPVQSCCSREDGVCACDLETFLGFRQPTISHHMKLLVEAGFVTAEKRGRWVYYELNSEVFQEVVAWLEPFVRHSAPSSAR